MNDRNLGDVLLEVNNLSVSFPGKSGELKAVNSVSYAVRRGEIMGIVGESGSGKSVEAYAVMRLLKAPGKVAGGSITFAGKDVLSLKGRELQNFRGGDIGMIFQDPMQCLDPVFTIGSQLIETFRAHNEGAGKKEAAARAVEMLASVGIHDPEKMMHRYPFELSGGMLQRVMIAMALLCSPELLIADEPTTALDVTIQDQIMLLLKKICREKNMAMIFITHDFGLVADICDSVTVLYGGVVQERGSTEDIFYRCAHPYTSGLMRAIPGADLLSQKRLVSIEGAPHDPVNPPKGCVFAPRCPYCMDICREKAPSETELAEGHSAACWRLSENVREVTANG